MRLTRRTSMGDYAVARICDGEELAYNACQDRARFLREIALAARLGIGLSFLCEHGAGIKCLDDVRSWVNPRLVSSKLAVSGPRLYRILCCIQNKYGIGFRFCDPAKTGERIVQLLR